MATLHKFMVYAPDYKEEGTFEKRLGVRTTHLENIKPKLGGFIRVGGVLLSPESIATPDAEKKMVGSMFICEAESIEKVREIVESDVYYTSGVELKLKDMRTERWSTRANRGSVTKHMSQSSAPNRFFVYAPDKQGPGMHAKRYAVRGQHMADIKPRIESGVVQVGGMVVSSDQSEAEQGQKKAEASMLIIKAETIDEVKAMVEGDVYYTSGVSEMNNMFHSTCRVLYNPLRTASAVRPRFITLPRLMSTQTQYNYILTSSPEPGVALITLNRPKALNALCSPLFLELNQAFREADADPSVTGADIKEMKDIEFADAYKNRFLEDWAEMTRIRKPIIAAVSGYALGGGCELALMCDIILASPTAKFGQPEINLGTIPGGGGSQRLARIIGKSRTMEMVLTGRQISAEEASQWGIVSRVVKEGEGEVVKEAISVAKEIASKSQIAVQAAKEVCNVAYELTLAEGLRFERRTFHGLFATKDQKEGMGAFAQKRKPNFTNE
ncbi:hypothetical protein H0H92_004515 [Tricholoma furcatifolium]|nr:hypothetical protein H0H92_004515 [Tricholoma furcatifolium]